MAFSYHNLTTRKSRNGDSTLEINLVAINITSLSVSHKEVQGLTSPIYLLGSWR
jgi:hypothetical protein